MPNRPDPVGVPLAHYLKDGETMGVRFSCNACQDSFDEPTDLVVARLKAAGLGDEGTGIRALAKLATRPCGRCGAVDWDTRPAYHPRPPRRPGEP